MKAHVLRWVSGLASVFVGLAYIAAVQGQSTAAPAKAPVPAAATAGAPAAASATFSKEQLEQLVAPMALYPDPVVSQMLMASTYPLEIVEAARWLKANPGLKDKALEEGLKKQDWDASVKSLCGFPDVLKQMDENLDWTQDLGDAFLAQKTELMDTIQRMRGKAYDSGNLKTTEQQVVTQQSDKIIVIQPADPEVIYVPTYSPTVVYGGWSYPSYYYPPMYYPPPYGYGAMAFTVGVVWGAAIWGGCNWGWGGSDVDIDINRQNNFNRNTSIDGGRNQVSNRAGGKQSWQHDASHRGGVNYRDSKTAQQFGAQSGSNRVSRDQARGYDRSGAGGGQRGPSASTGAVGGRDVGASTRDAGASTRDAGAASRNAGASTRDAGAASRNAGASSRGSAGSSAYSGSRNSSFDRSASSRGGMSRGGGGMSRGGGGARRR
jgi:hypothetical protein